MKLEELHLNYTRRDLAFHQPRSGFQKFISTRRSIQSIYLGIGNFDPSGPDPAISFLRLLNPTDLESIKHLAIEEELEPLYPDEEEEMVGLTKMGLKSLESVTIVSSLKKKMEIVLQRWKKGGGRVSCVENQ